MFACLLLRLKNRCSNYKLTLVHNFISTKTVICLVTHALHCMLISHHGLLYILMYKGLVNGPDASHFYGLKVPVACGNDSVYRVATFSSNQD